MIEDDVESEDEYIVPPNMFKYMRVSESDIRRASGIDRLILENIALVGHFAGKMVSFTNIVSRDDIFQAGLEGLVRSAKLYNPALNIKFSTYASTSILRSIWASLVNSMYPVYMNTKTAKKCRAIRSIIAKRQQENRPEPGIRELAVMLHTDFESAYMLYTFATHTTAVNVDDIQEKEDDDPRYKVTVSTNDIDNMFVLNDTMLAAHDIISALPLLEASVMLLRTGLYDSRWYSVDEVGYILDIPPGRVRDIEMQGISHIRDRQFTDAISSHFEELSPWEYINAKLYEKQAMLTQTGCYDNISLDECFGESIMSGNIEITNDELYEVSPDDNGKSKRTKTPYMQKQKTYEVKDTRRKRKAGRRKSI